MNASKTLTALAAAAALVGTIGYASAQSSGANDGMSQSPAVTPADSTNSTTTPTQPMDSTNSTTPSGTSTTTTPSDAGTSGTTSSGTASGGAGDNAATMDAERAPQADRN